MDDRLVQLLDSFSGAQGQYALARLSFALHHPKVPAPPVIGGLAERSEAVLREQWAQVERDLEAANAFAQRFAVMRRGGSIDPELRLYRQSLGELDRSARAIRWVLTITESPEYDC